MRAGREGREQRLVRIDVDAPREALGRVGDDAKHLRVEKVVPAGKTVNVRIRALKPGTYAFIDDFNHQATGRIVAE